MSTRYTHTNLVAHDWRRLSRFYQEVFGCRPLPPPRSHSGDWLARGVGVPGVSLEGEHLLMPGHGPEGPTLEIFTYHPTEASPEPRANRAGLAHLAFRVESVPDHLDAMVAAGGSRLGEVVVREVEGVGTLTFTYARDPEGNLVELQSWERSETTGPPPREVPVEAAYDSWAESYDTGPNPTRDLDAVVLRRLLPDLAGQRVLEIGCGTGKNTPALRGADRVVGLDLSEAMLERARRRLESGDGAPVEFVRHDLTRGLPFPDGSFEVVTSNLVLEHVEDLGPVLREVARVLTPGGLALLVEFHPYRQFQGRGARFRLPEGGEEILVPFHVHHLGEFHRAARDAGLVLEDLQEWCAPEDPQLARPPGPEDLPRLLSLRFRLPA